MEIERKSLMMEVEVDFMKTFIQMFADKSNFVRLHNQREAKHYIMSNLPRGSKIWTDLEDGNPKESRIPIGFTNFRPFYQGYVNFLMMNPQVKAKESRSLI